MTPLVESVLDDLFDHFAELDDRDDAPLGEYATVFIENNVLTVMNENETVGVVITVEMI